MGVVAAPALVTASEGEDDLAAGMGEGCYGGADQLLESVDREWLLGVMRVSGL